MRFVVRMEVINMLQMELLDCDKVYKRVDKRIARKEFNNGMVVHLTTSRAYPGSIIGSCNIQMSSDLDSFDTFDNYVNSFKYYNCNSELGNRVNYFIEK